VDGVDGKTGCDGETGGIKASLSWLSWQSANGYRYYKVRSFVFYLFRLTCCITGCGGAVSRVISVVTPENIPLEVELAGLGTRFGALLFDLLLQIITILIAAAIWGIIAAVTGGTGLDNIATALSIISIFLIFFGYFILFETIWNGQTPGKRMFKLRVIRDGGFPVSFMSVAARNLVRIADFLPGTYVVGALSVFFNDRNKRLGDLVAGTMVVKEDESHRLGIYDPEAASAQAAYTPARLPDHTNDPRIILSIDEINLLRRFSIRRWQMTSDDSERLAYRIVAPLVGRLGIVFMPGVAPRYADLASAIIADVDRRDAEAEEGNRS
jgi:uncharacterized RDD family membrane protein YckC